MSINQIPGQLLQGNLERDGIDLSISNANVGIGTLFPAAKLEVVGNVVIGNVQIGNIGTITAKAITIPVPQLIFILLFYLNLVAPKLIKILWT